jgi:hypothetical protein
MMADIYSAAGRVDVWLGDPAALRLKGNEAQDRWLARPWQERFMKYLSARSVSRLDLAFWLPLLFTGRLQRLLDALMATEPQWEGRLWVAQEYVLAKKICFCFGYEEIWQRPHMLFDVMQMHMEQAKIAENGTLLKSPLQALQDRCADMDIFQNMFMLNGRRQASLTDVVNTLELTEASNARDFVYAILGMMNPVHAQLIAPRYDDDVWKVYADATYATITSTGALNIIRFGGDSSASIHGLPSWVPDLSAGGSLGLVWISNEGVVRWQVGKHQAARHSLSRDSRELTIAGTNFSTVSDSIDVLWREDDTLTLAAEDSQISPKYGRSPMELLLSPTQWKPQSLENGDCHLRRMQDHRIIQASHSPEVHNLNELKGMPESASLEELMIAIFEEWNETRAKWPKVVEDPHSPFQFFYYWRRRFGLFNLIRLQNDLIGVTDCKAQAGDLVVLPELDSMPLLLRRCGEEFRFCGFAYVHGIMNEELLEVWAGCEIVVEGYTLV